MKLDPFWLLGGAAVLLGLAFSSKSAPQQKQTTPTSDPYARNPTVGDREVAAAASTGSCLKYLINAIDGQTVRVPCPPGVSPGTIIG